MCPRLKISVLVDDPHSWIVPYARNIVNILSRKHDVRLYFKATRVRSGDMLFLLGCTRMVSLGILARNTHNLVIHESDLPKGRGWSPMGWQILQGKNRIPIVLFEASDKTDAGSIYFKDYIDLEGTELLPEIRKKQAAKTEELICRFVNQWPDVVCRLQKGTPTYFPRRTRSHDRLDPHKTIIANFNHLRIANNEEYPLWFEYKGKKYMVKIYPFSEDRQSK